MNCIVVPVRNNLHLTKKAIRSFRNQDIGNLKIIVIDNDSTDGSGPWLQSQPDIIHLHHKPGLSVAESWNKGLGYALDKWCLDYCLVVNNDVELRPDTYRLLVEDGGLFVTAVGSSNPECIKPRTDYIMAEVKEGMYKKGDPVFLDKIQNIGPYYAPPNPDTKRPHPDFSCFLIRKEAWQKVGKFDEEFKIAFCEDGDMDLRLYKAGIRAYCLDLPFLHHGSMTIRNADPKENRMIQRQADLNRGYFERKWGFRMASEEYYRALGKDGPVEDKVVSGVDVRPTEQAE